MVSPPGLWFNSQYWSRDLNTGIWLVNRNLAPSGAQGILITIFVFLAQIFKLLSKLSLSCILRILYQTDEAKTTSSSSLLTAMIFTKTNFVTVADISRLKCNTNWALTVDLSNACDQYRPIRSQYSGHVISADQSEGSWTKTMSHMVVTLH